MKYIIKRNKLDNAMIELYTELKTSSSPVVCLVTTIHEDFLSEEIIAELDNEIVPDIEIEFVLRG